jgi:hypothetical protein
VPAGGRGVGRLARGPRRAFDQPFGQHGAIVTHHLIVKWRKKTVKRAQLQEKEEKHLNKKVLSDGALQQFFAW